MATRQQRQKKQQQQQIWNLPDAILFRVLEYAAAPTHRACILTQQVAPLCRDSFRAILRGGIGDDERRGSEKNKGAATPPASPTSEGIWEMILKQDYGVALEEEEDDGEGGFEGPNAVAAGASSSSSGGKRRRRNSRQQGAQNNSRRRRHSKRLKRSPIHKVRDAHQLMKDNTEIAFFYLSEMVAASDKKNLLTPSKFVGLLNEYGPHLRVNTLISTGGLFLVEVCRARKVSESTVLKCAKELVENRGALVDASTSESNSTHETPLCVASARGMPSVVKYLLEKGADVSHRSSGRFRLHTRRTRTVKCVNNTPLEFCEAMLAAEITAGAKPSDLKRLKSCKRLLLLQKKKAPARRA